MANDLDVAVRTGARLGAGPTWDAATGTLLWVDAFAADGAFDWLATWAAEGRRGQPRIAPDRNPRT